jgi:hypothetical protein
VPDQSRLKRSPDAAADHRLMFAKFLAELLDQRFTIPGTSIRIGLDPIIGLIPGIGDTLANLAGSAILVIAAQLRLPKIVLLRMGWNIAVNTLIGAIPLVGDIFSIWFRSNVKNVQLLERYATRQRRSVAPADWAFVIALVIGLLLLLAAILALMAWALRQIIASF